MTTKHLTTHKGGLKISIPSNLKELTVGQVMQIQEYEQISDIEMLSILSKVPLSKLGTVKDYADFAVFSDYIESLIHQIKYCYDQHPVPDTVTFKLDKRPKWYKRKSITVPVKMNFKIEPSGAFLASADIIQSEIKAHVEQYGEQEWMNHYHPKLSSQAYVLAQYFYTKVTSKEYSINAAEAFINEIKKLSIAEATPIAAAFFLDLPNSSRPKLSFWQGLKIAWQNRRAQRNLKSSRTTIG